MNFDDFLNSAENVAKEKGQTVEELQDLFNKRFKEVSLDLNKLGTSLWPEYNKCGDPSWNYPESNPFQLFGMYYWYDEGYEIHGPYDSEELAKEDCDENERECWDYLASLNNNQNNCPPAEAGADNE